MWWCVLDMRVCVSAYTQQCWHTCVLRLLPMWSTLRVSEVAVPPGLCYSDVKRGERCFTNVAGLTALTIIVFQALKGLALYFWHIWLPHAFSNLNISDCEYWSWQGTAVSDVLVCCMTGFNIPCLLIACLTCVWGVSLRKKRHHMTYWGIMRQLVGFNWKNLCVRWPVPTLKSAKSCARCQVPVKRNYRASALFGLSSSSSGGRLLQAHSAL